MTQEQHPRTIDNGLLARLRQGEPCIWLREPGLGLAPDATPLQPDELLEAEARFARFAPVLAQLFPAEGWDGVIRSSLEPYPVASLGTRALWLKGDHALPIARSVKARGGVYEVLCHLEDLALAEGLWTPGAPMTAILAPVSRDMLGRHCVVVASTGNLGYSIGMTARAFGLRAEIHMSHDAKAWKKERLRDLGARVVEHACDYTEAVARARTSAAAQGAYFVDDEDSRRLFVGYATAGRELAEQLEARGLIVGRDRPLIVYLPCGVGGAPGGITAGLKAIYGAHVRAVFVEPIASACVFAALATGSEEPVSVYAVGLDNNTLADGLAVSAASRLVLQSIGRNIDGAAAVTEAEMRDWVRRGWREAGLRLEPSAAAAFAAAARFGEAVTAPDEAPIEVVWATGGALLPDAEFEALLGAPLQL